MIWCLRFSTRTKYIEVYRECERFNWKHVRKQCHEWVSLPRTCVGLCTISILKRSTHAVVDLVLIVQHLAWLMRVCLLIHLSSWIVQRLPHTFSCTEKYLAEHMWANIWHDDVKTYHNVIDIHCSRTTCKLKVRLANALNALLMIRYRSVQGRCNIDMLSGCWLCDSIEHSLYSPTQHPTSSHTGSGPETLRTW